MEHHHHERINRAFITGIVLNTVFVAIEAATGLITGSLALLTDAGHNLADVTSLVIALFALKLSTVSPNKLYTYGYKKATILAALLNAIILLVVVGGIVYEAVMRLFHPLPVEGGVVAIVAGVGIIVNTVTALLFFRDKDKDVNVKGAYLHLAADALVSLGVVIAGIVITFTSWYWLDSVISMTVSVIIFISTWSLLKDTIRLSLDGVPQNINVNEIKLQLLNVPGVVDIHHLHIWGLSTTQVALTCHVVLRNDISMKEIPHIKTAVRASIKNLGIQHATLEIETNSENCTDKEDCE
jgi:cobalt-zinc-cadmium efflux system protein